MGNEVIYECCPEPYLDITYIIKIRRSTIPYWKNVIIPSFAITSVSIMTLLIPSTSPNPRFITIFLLFILFSFTIPKDLPELCLLSSMLGWCYFILFSVLIHSIIVTVTANSIFLQSFSCNSKISRSMVNTNCCGRGGELNQFSGEQVRHKIVKTLDIAGILVILVIFLLGFGGSILSAPHFFVY